jgi:DNA-binding response OmpR family regulator
VTRSSVREPGAPVILVADDDQDTRFMLQLLLENAGWECVLASGGLEAVRLATERAPELMILDVMMPDLSGFDAYRRIREIPGRESTPILFLSGAGDTRRVVTGFDLGAEDYLVKPFNKVTLLAKIRNVIARYRKQKQLSLQDFAPGAIIRDRYEVQLEVGRGGMGVVYQTFDRNLHTVVALKVLHTGMDRFEAAGRFEREVKAIALIEHPNLIRLYDAEFGADIQFYTMEFLDGPSLADRLDEVGPLSAIEALVYTAKVAEALQAVHDLGYLHRDVKPENILFRANQDEPILTDFSLILDYAGPSRRLTQAGLVVGTVGYLSPEALFPGNPLDVRADIYSLGVVLYQLLTGRIPFDGLSDADIMMRTVKEPVPPPTILDPLIPHAAVEVCMRALRREPSARYSSAGDMAAAARSAIAILAR